MGDEPGACDEGQGDEQDAVAVTRQALPGGGLEVIEGGEGHACQQAVEPGPCRIIDKLVIGFAKAGLFGQDIVPHDTADCEAEQEEDGKEPDGLLSGAEGNDEEGEDKVKLFFDAE